MCRARCGYCDFYSEVLDPARVDPLVDALLIELDQMGPHLAPPCETIFVGGGTPTVLPAAALARLLGGLRACAGPDTEFTVEANPATVTPAIAAVLAAAGVNRLSVGAQSFVPAELAALDRTHRPEQVGETVRVARDAGLRRLSLDLIFGIPGQTLASWATSLGAALALEPEHLSCYGLTIEPGTALAARVDAGVVQPMKEELEAALYEHTIDALAAAGLRQYEISNFARSGAECRHNLIYWRNEPCVGIGPAAAGLIGEVRYKNVADTAAYVAALEAGRSARVEQECLPAARRAGETAMLALRLVAGIDRARFAARFGEDPAEMFAAAIERHVRDGLLEMDDSRVRLTRAGRLVANRVMTDFV